MKWAEAEKKKAFNQMQFQHGITYFKNFEFSKLICSFA